MAAPRTACFTSFLRVTSSSTRCSSRCSRCQRTFSSSKGFFQSSKRQLMTDSAYRPTTLDPGPPPPRNANVPDTSIAGGASSWNNSSPWFPQPENRMQASQEPPPFSIPEQEAQKPKPVLQDVPSEQSAGAKNARPMRMKFRPRKAAMTLTAAAVEHLRELLDSPEPKLIRIGVKTKGCSGSAYHLEYVDKPGRFDEQVEQDGVKVLIDSKALLKVIGSEMDWVEDKLSARFTFKNPNITEQCGCGESFSTA